MRTLICLAAVVLCALPAQAQESKGLKLALSAMAIGQSLDTISTIGALNRGAVESNALLGAHPSPAKLIAAKLPMIGVGWLLVKLAPHHPRLAKGVAFTIGGIGAGLAISNSRKGRR